jgi:hypothetical protein
MHSSFLTGILMMLFFLTAIIGFVTMMSVSDERSYRKSIKIDVRDSRARCAEMKQLIERARKNEGTTQNGVEGARRLIKGAEGSIADAETVLTGNQRDKETFRKASAHLSIARNLLDKVPAAIADAPGGDH